METGPKGLRGRRGGAASLAVLAICSLQSWLNPAPQIPNPTGADAASMNSSAVQRADVIEDIIDIINTILGGGGGTP